MPTSPSTRRARRVTGAPPPRPHPARSVVAATAAPSPPLSLPVLAFAAAAAVTGVVRPVGGATIATASVAGGWRGGDDGGRRSWQGGVTAVRRPAGAATLLRLRGGTGSGWAGSAVAPALPRRRLLKVSPGGDAAPPGGLPSPPPGLSWVVVVCASAGQGGDGPQTPPPGGPDGDGGAAGSTPTPTADTDAAVTADAAAAEDDSLRPWWAPITPLWTAVKRAGFVLGLATGLAVSGVVLFAPEGGGVDSAGVAAVREKTTLFEYILTDLQRGYVEEVDMDALFEAGVEGMLGTLDPYTSFESVAEARELSLKTAGKYVREGYGGVGLGISLDRRDPSRVVVISAFEGYAYDAGVRPGDVLETVNGQPVVNLGVSATSDLLRGDPGTPVSITVARTGEAAPLSFSLTRRRVVIKDVPVAALLGTPSEGVAYIRLASFARDAAEECRFALRGLDAAVREAGGPGVTSLVLDLRGNPGGLLTSAVEVAEVVLPKGSVVVSTKGRGLGQEPRYISSADPAIGPAVRLAVLVNGGTASASEIVAGAVQDLDRGVVVGSRTFGKGLVQNVQTLPYDTALKYTVGKYYTPSGRCIQSTNYSTASVTPALPAPPPPPTPITPAPPSVPSAPVPLLPPDDDAEPDSPITDASPATDAPDIPAPALSPEAPSSPGTGPDGRPPALPRRPVGPPGTAYKSRAITESERREFRTASGRLVRDGGGIEADVSVPVPPPSDLEAALRTEAAFFYYAAEYAAGLPADSRETLPEDFAVTDALYADFVAWVTDNAVVSDGGPALPSAGASEASVRAKSPSVSSLPSAAAGTATRAPPAIKLESRFVEAYAQLEEALRSAGYDTAVESVGALKAATAAELRADFTRHEKALRAALDDAIRQRLQPDSDRMVAALEGDEALGVALEVVRDGERYAGVLRSPTVTFAAGVRAGAEGGEGDAEGGEVAHIARVPKAANR
ncbi:hypothetical protein MMPV_004559 [Pyropia vietnamensis]